MCCIDRSKGLQSKGTRKFPSTPDRLQVSHSPEVKFVVTFMNVRTHAVLVMPTFHFKARNSRKIQQNNLIFEASPDYMRKEEPCIDERQYFLWD